jgi:hypothetical protein
MAAVMAMVHEEMHERTGQDDSHGSAPKTCAVSVKETRDNKKTARHNPYRGPPPRLFVLFMIHPSAQCATRPNKL